MTYPCAFVAHGLSTKEDTMRPITSSFVSPGITNAIPLDTYAYGNVGVQVVMDPAVSVTMEMTNDNIYDSTITPAWFNSSDAGTVGVNAPFQSTINTIPKAIRFNCSGVGNVRWVIIQNGETG